MSEGNSRAAFLRRHKARTQGIVEKMIAEARADLDDADRRLACSPATAEEREQIRFAISEARQQIELMLTYPTRASHRLLADPLTADCVRRATAHIGASIDARGLGVAPFGLLFRAAQDLGAAIVWGQHFNMQREKSSPRLSASRRLRQLASQFPEKSAAELRRILEAESGGRMDPSAARAVVRSVRELQKRGG